MVTLTQMRKAGKIGCYVLSDYTHLVKNEVHDLRLSVNECFHDVHGTPIGLRVLWELQLLGFFPRVSQHADMFPHDLQKVSPLLRLLACASDLLAFNDAKATADQIKEAKALGRFFQHVQMLFDALDVKRVDQLQPNPANKPVLTYEQRVQMVIDAGAYFDTVRDG